MTRPFSLKNRARSFVYAGCGVIAPLKTQHNTWLHCTAMVVVAGMAYALDVTREDGL